MSLLEKTGLAILHRLEPETAHTAAIMALRHGLISRIDPPSSTRLNTKIAGISLANPIGLAAGFDKNATALSALSKSGFGFLEIGAATPRPQPGNPKPRLFRLTQDRAAINRFGFNNDGMDVIADRLMRRPADIPIGLNLGANKNSDDRANDFSQVLATCGPYVDFATVNVSSPNTENLRDLQGKAALSALLDGVMATRDALPNPIPVFLKIAPDLTDPELQDIANAAQKSGINAIIATNTTLARDGLTSRHKAEIGGLSGAPLFVPSTRVLARLAVLTGGDIPLIGVGGIATAKDALAKIKAGASAVQLYTAMVYGGIGLAAKIAKDLDTLLAAEGFDNISDAIGIETENWL